MDKPAIYTEEHKTGTFHAEDHGANVAGVYYRSRRMKRPHYVATAKVNDVEFVKRRIAWYIEFKGLNK